MKKNLMKKIKKDQKGSITLFVLVTCIFFLIVVLLANINIINKKNNQKKQVDQIIENYKVSSEELEKEYNGLYKETDVYVALKEGDTLCFYNNQKEAEKDANKYYDNVKNRVFKRSYSQGPNTPWYEDSAQITKVEFCTEIRPINMACYFSDLSALTEIKGLQNLYTDQVTSMFALFYNCKSLGTIDVSKFKTSKVTTMDAMFYNCTVVSNITGLNNLDTSKVTNMNSMFANCKGLTTIDISNFDTSNVEQMAYMFMSASKLQSITFPRQMNTSKLTTIIEIFAGCESLLNLDLNNWNTANVTDMSNAFWNCKALTEIKLESWNTEKVTNMRHMFRGCEKLTSIDLSGWKTPNVNSFDSMLSDCTQLKVVDCREFIIKEGANVAAIFHGCTSITNLNISKMDFSKVGTWGYAFYNVPINAKITTNKATKSWLQTVYKENFTNIETID